MQKFLVIQKQEPLLLLTPPPLLLLRQKLLASLLQTQDAGSRCPNQSSLLLKLVAD